MGLMRLVEGDKVKRVIWDEYKKILKKSGEHLIHLNLLKDLSSMKGLKNHMQL
jgi:hypothetical protein